jgi:Predicted metal-dependent hydrolase of the TIM-barrel fold
MNKQRRIKNNIMNNNNYFDAHCHIFTLRFGLKEAKSMLYDILTGRYPWHAPSAGAVKRLSMPDWSGIKALLKQFYELISASFGSEEENLDFLQKEALKALPNIKWYIAPLMMDIFYLLAYPLDRGKMISQTRRVALKSINETEFQKAWDEILDDLEKHIKSKVSNVKNVKLVKGTVINNALQAIKDERKVGEILTSKAGLVRTKGFYQTAGFCFHLNNLVNLATKRKGELYPFIAVDPRRPGIIDEIISGKYISNNGPFYGIKLYPRMGYHPQSASMDALYNYCNEQKIPITFHCGKSGFPPGTGWKYADFGNPVNFEPIIKKYSNLRINFAHLGSSDPTYDWAKTIISLMNKYDNVYSDLSCYTDIKDLKAAKNFWDENPKLKSRLMFGSDFDVMYFTGEITMASYFANFEKFFSASDLKLLMNDNPIKFLGL